MPHATAWGKQRYASARHFHSAIAIAWILRHPAKMQAIIGSMSPAHIAEACAAADITLTHHDWYRLYLAAGKFLP